MANEIPTHTADKAVELVFPPFDPAHWTSQLFWLAVLFAILYVLMSRVALPRVAGILADRAAQIEADLTAAREAQTQAVMAQASHDRMVAEARAAAQLIAQEAHRAAADEVAARQRELEVGLAQKLARADAEISASRMAAMGSVGAIARDLTIAIVQQLTGRPFDALAYDSYLAEEQARLLREEERKMTEIEKARRLVASVPHWHHIFEIAPGVVTPGSYDPNFLWQKLHLPSDLAGKRVLDIGTSDGFFAMNLARRGAKVVAVDYRRKEEHGYHVMERLNPISVDYRVMNVFDLDDDALGTFDIVLFLGVLYHLPDLVRALHLIRKRCRGTLYVETHSDNDFSPDVPAARYYKAATLAGDHTNFWSPNPKCVADMLFDCGFDVVREEIWQDRMFCEARAVEVTGLRADKMIMGYGTLASAGQG